MRINTLASLAAIALVASAAPTQASDWSKNVDICAAAAEEQGVVAAESYRTKFLSGYGASVKTIAIELIPTDGDSIVTECTIRRGEVTDLVVKA